MDVSLPQLDGPEVEAWGLLFDLHSAYPIGWALVGAQMVILHASRYGVARPVRTRDSDVLVDIRTVDTQDIARWLLARGFDLEGVSTDGIGHRFVRDDITIDLLSIDHVGNASRLTIPPARTVEVPGGRQAIARVARARVSVGGTKHVVPVPDWAGAILLKARASLSLPEDREKHLRDFALLLGLPVDLLEENTDLSDSEKKRVAGAAELLTQETWMSVESAIDPRDGEAALGILLASGPSAR